MNIEKHDRELTEKEKDLHEKALGKNEKELLVIENFYYQTSQYIIFVRITTCNFDDMIQLLHDIIINN